MLEAPGSFQHIWLSPEVASLPGQRPVGSAQCALSVSWGMITSPVSPPAAGWGSRFTGTNQPTGDKKTFG